MNKAIIFIDAKSDDNKECPLSFLKVGGLSLLSRQLKQLAAVGISHVYLLSFSMPEKLHQALPQFKNIVDKLEVVDANFTDTSFWDGIEKAMLIEEGRLIDQRILNTVLTHEHNNSIAHFDEDDALFGAASGLMLEINGKSKLFASCALVSGDCLKIASLATNYKTHPVAEILNTMVREGESIGVNVSNIDPYLADQLRDVPILWRPVSKQDECTRSTKLLIEHAQNGVLDWPSRFIHPIFENILTFYTLPTFVSPTILTLFTVLFGFYVSYLFSIGQMGAALAGAMIIGVIYGVRQKLSVVKLQLSKLSPGEHILDNIVEYAWYLSMALYFSNVSESTGLWAVGLIVILFSWATFVQARFYRCLTSQHLDDTGVFERALRLIGANRNTRVWALAIFALSQNLVVGFWALAIYTAITFFAYQWRFIVRANDYLSKVSEAVAGNISKTKFLD